MTQKQKDKLTLLVDFDGVLHSYKSGWKGAGTIPDPPVPGAIAWLIKMVERYEVAIYSSRSKEEAGLNAMKAALTKWASEDGLGDSLAAAFVSVLVFPTEKPAAWLTIDDRCICFNGVFPTLEEIDQFQPWYRK